MERDQYWPCGEDGTCEPSPTQNSSPIWTVDRAIWEDKGGTTIGTADPPDDRKFGEEGNATDKTEIGTLPLGKGRVVIFGGLLPQPTEHYPHWFGLDAYTISTPGQQMLLHALTYGRAGLHPLPKCKLRRSVVIRLPRKLRSARVTLRGKRQKVLHGKRLRARIRISRLPSGRYRARVVGRTRGGRRVHAKRTVRVC
jgi:hypothetical protein